MEACRCEKCSSACRTDPGRFLPGEVERLAAHLGMDAGELYRTHLILERLEWRDRTIWVPAPAKLKTRFRYVTKPGHRARSYHEAERGTCVFLTEEGLCAIHSVKPYECGAYMGCRHTFQGRPYKASAVESFFFNHWKGAQDTLPDLPDA